MKTARVVVHGRVQGVVFRQTCKQEATAAGVSGWVRNRGDGVVEAVFEGDDDAVDRMCAWCEDGPPDAQVVRVETSHEEPRGDRGFTIRS